MARPEIIADPTCSQQTLHEALHNLQWQINQIYGNVNVDLALTGLWGKATMNWSTSGYVDVNPCDDSAGTNPDTGTTHRVYFTGDGDPNVVTDEVIPYQAMEDGTYRCLKVNDDELGTVREAHNTLSRQGWALADGTANSVGNGGTGINRVGKYAKGHGTTAGNTGGAATHSHTITVDSGGAISQSTGSSTIGFAITNSALTSITVDAHTSSDVASMLNDHSKQDVADALANHTQADIVAAIADHTDGDIIGAIADHDSHDHNASGAVEADTNADGTTATVVGDGDTTDFENQALSHAESGQDVAHGQGGSEVSHGPHATNDALDHTGVAMQSLTHTVNDSGHTHNLTDPGHTHTMTVSAHTHTASSSTESSEPPYVTVLYYERIDNSEEFVNP